MIDFISFLKSKIYIVFVLLLGILLMIISNMDFSHSRESHDMKFDSEIEKKITSVIKSTYSLEEVSVIITYDSYGEKILEYDYVESMSGGDNEKKSYQKNFVTNESDKTPFIKSEKLPTVRGVLISAKNADEKMSMEIRCAVATLLGIKINKVHVIY